MMNAAIDLEGIARQHDWRISRRRIRLYGIRTELTFTRGQTDIRAELTRSGKGIRLCQRNRPVRTSVEREVCPGGRISDLSVRLGEVKRWLREDPQ